MSELCFRSRVGIPLVSKGVMASGQRSQHVQRSWGEKHQRGFAKKARVGQNRDSKEDDGIGQMW